MFAGREQPLSYVACVPVVERGGGRSMIGVLKVLVFLCGGGLRLEYKKSARVCIV